MMMPGAGAGAGFPPVMGANGGGVTGAPLVGPGMAQHFGRGGGDVRIPRPPCCAVERSACAEEKLSAVSLACMRCAFALLPHDVVHKSDREGLICRCVAWVGWAPAECREWAAFLDSEG